MDKQDFEALKKFSASKLKLKEDDLLEKSMSIFSMYSHYYDIFINELKVLKKLRLDRERLYSDLYKKIRMDSYGLKNKSEIEPYIFSEDEYYELALNINDQEIVVKYLEDMIDYIRKSSFQISNLVSLIKIKRGIE